MQALVSFYVGLNDKDAKTQIISNQDAKTIITKCMVKYFEFGGTLFDCCGVYAHNDGTNIIVVESSFKVEILTDCKDDQFNKRCSRFVNVLKRVLNQETILQTSVCLDAKFI